MPRYRAAVEVHAQPGVFDPAGQAVARALAQLGHASVAGVRVGRHLLLQLEAPDLEAASREVEAMCRELLANPVIETFRFTLAEVAPDAADPEPGLQPVAAAAAMPPGDGVPAHPGRAGRAAGRAVARGPRGEGR